MVKASGFKGRFGASRRSRLAFALYAAQLDEPTPVDGDIPAPPAEEPVDPAPDALQAAPPGRAYVVYSGSYITYGGSYIHAPIEG